MKLLHILTTILIILVLVVGGHALYHWIALKPFYTVANPEFENPGLEDPEFDAQGITRDDEAGLLMFGGYMRDHTAGPVYLVDLDSGKVTRKVLLQNEDGTPFTGHAGGLTVVGDYLYVAGSSDCCLYVYSRRDLMNAADGESIRALGAFPTKISDEDGVKVSFVASGDGMVYVGEFHMVMIPQYESRKNHHMQKNGKKTFALMAAFRVNPEAPFGLDPDPVCAYCLPELVQGCVPYGKDFILSRSWMLILSDLCRYEPEPAGEMSLMNVTVPLYTLNARRGIKAPPMSEEIEILGDQLYVASELDNYMWKDFGALWGGSDCFSVPLTQLIE